MANDFKPFWLVWCEDGRNPTYKHTTEESAKREAERLAEKYPHTVFVVLEAKGACKKTDIEWSYPTREAAAIYPVPF